MPCSGAEVFYELRRFGAGNTLATPGRSFDLGGGCQEIETRLAQPGGGVFPRAVEALDLVLLVDRPSRETGTIGIAGFSEIGPVAADVSGDAPVEGHEFG